MVAPPRGHEYDGGRPAGREPLDGEAVALAWEGDVLGLYKVAFAGLIQRIVNARETTLTLPPGSTLGGLLHELTVRYGPEFQEQLTYRGELSPHATVLIDGHNAQALRGLDTVLDEHGPGQVEIVLLGPPIMGG